MRPIPPLVIGGMGRSGTSAAARLLQAAGLDVGTDLMAADDANRLGYFEDLTFFEFNRELLRAGLEHAPDLQPRWAFADRMDRTRLEPFRDRARELLRERGERGVAWGFKDPRTTMLLGFYDEAEPRSRFLFVYRPPWDVLDSLARVRGRPFAGRVDVALATWTAYNRAIADFLACNRERCALIHAAAVGAAPGEVIQLVNGLLEGAGVPPLRMPERDLFDPALMARLPDVHPVAELVRADHPAVAELYDELEQAADLPAPVGGAPGELPLERRTGRGALPLDVVLVAAGPVPAPGPERCLIAVAPGASPARAANAAAAASDAEVVCVAFGAPPDPGVLETAVSALHGEDGPAVVLLAPGQATGAAGVEELARGDLLAVSEPGLGILTPRSLWQEIGGLPTDMPPTGFDGWAFGVAAAARAVRVSRLVTGAVRTGEPPSAAERTRAHEVALSGHPELAIPELLAGRDRAERRVADAEAELDALRRDRDRVERERAALDDRLETLTGSRSWRAIRGFRRLRGRLRAR